MDIWTPRVTARAELAETLAARFRARATDAGVLAEELEALAKHGRAAEQAERQQKEQLAANATARASQKELTQGVFAREDALRDRLPAVVASLKASAATRDLGDWIGRLSFARYRFHEIAPAAAERPAEGAADAELRSVERVERRDATTQLNGLEAFCQALLRPGREPVVDKLAARGLPRAAIESLAADARKLIDLGPNVPRPAEATASETEAVRAQKAVWKSCRRMLRKAVHGVPELESVFARC